MSLPAIFFYPADWLSDDVAACSLAAQGLWLRMMIKAHFSKRYGYLCDNGGPIPPETLWRVCGAASLEEYLTLLAELDRNGVPRRTPEGIIYSKRMVDDAKLRAIRQKAGKLGGNPKLRRSVLVNLLDNQEDNQNTEDGNGSKSLTKQKRIEQQRQALELYAHYPRKVGRSAALNAIVKALQLKPFDELRDSVCAYACAVSAWPADAQKFVPHPATWFNQARYDDDRTTWQRDDGMATPMTPEEKRLKYLRSQL